jgi:hypothetical protein
MQMILSKQEQIIQGYGLSNPLVSIKQYRDTLAKFVHMAGFKDATSFMNDITPEQAQQLAQADQPKTDPTIEATQILAQVEREKADLKSKTEMAKLDLEREQMQLENARNQLELQMQEMKMQAEAQNNAEKTRGDQTKIIIEALSKFNDMQKGDMNVG